MSRELYRTHTRAPDRGTIWHDTKRDRYYRVTKTKWCGAVGIVYGTPATLADAQRDLNDALREFGHRLRDALPR